MFTTLYLKEWKEKARLFFFELGILALLFAGQLVFKEKKDIREWLIYAVLMLFYPFAALVLGAAGFEAEYRQGAWAYLFSRPVGRAKVWLAKFAALASMLVALWLVFVALWAAVPAIRELVGGSRGLIGFSVALEFPWWSILASAFLLVVTFSLSLLHERQFNLLFLALIIAFLLPAAAWAFLNTKAGGFLASIAPEKALSTFVFFFVMAALTFAASSLMTLVRSDFSQPRKLTLGFLRRFVVFFTLALACTAAWALLTPYRGSDYIYSAGSFGGDAYYQAEKGFFKYSSAEDRIRWLAKDKYGLSWWMDVAGGRIAYVGYVMRSPRETGEELWIADANGRHRKRIIGRGSLKKGWPGDISISGLLLSPDGGRIAVLTSAYRIEPKARKSSPLWLADTDGTRLESLPDDPGLFEHSKTTSWIQPLAWTPNGRNVLFYKITYGRPRTTSLWLYDVKSGSARMLLANATLAAWEGFQSPDGGKMAVNYRKEPEGGATLGLLDLESFQVTDLVDEGTPEEGRRLISQVSWSPAGDRLAWVCRRRQKGSPDLYLLNVYSLPDRKLVAERTMTKAESAAQLYSPAWTSDGAKIVILDRESNGLRILGPDLAEVERIDLPRLMNTPDALEVVGNKALLREMANNRLWRCDLKAKRWKRIY